MGVISDAMRKRRLAIGVTQAALARELEVHEAQLRKWDTKVDPPSDRLVEIATALNFSVAELLGVARIGLDLSGEWHAVWETTRDGIPTLNKHELTARHSGEFVYFDADGDYDWLADFRLNGSRLKGTYQAVDERRNESGTMHLTLNHHGGVVAIGHWTGEYADGIGGFGFGVIARDPARADRLMKLLMDQGTHIIKEWPREDQP